MRASRSLRSAVVAAIALAAASPAAGVVPSGLHGIVRRGPIMPVCMIGQPCSAPVKTTLVFTRLGRRVLVRSNADGTYRALLAPGIYSVTTSPRIGFGVLKPARVKVRAGHVDRLDFYADTGIR